ncbi:MAG: Fe-S cluster assembly protein SufD [Odoribacteraceae bacterium]|jgi:Fe-S cluster assembly protein SufD|nr:Fe-S cluster assembly protein SufD [Odoribacteraceae bacterium]
MNKEEANANLLDLYRQTRGIPPAAAGDDQQTTAADQQPTLLDHHRAAAIARFTALGGLPDDTEAYRHAPLLPVFARDYRLTTRPPAPSRRARPFTCSVPGLDTHLCFTANGWYTGRDGDDELPPGITICSLAEAAARHPELLQKHYEQHTRPGDFDSTVALNTAFARDGLFIHVPDGITLDKPLQIINLATGNRDTLAFQRNLVILGRGASATLLVCDHALSDCRFLTNNLTEIALGDDAALDYYQVQNRHADAALLNSLFITQASSSRLDANLITLYGGLTRNNIFVALDGAGADCHLQGMHLSDKTQCVDNFTSIDHRAPRCRSNEHFKGVLDDAATANFTGLITVRPAAAGTEAYLANNNLLLADTARVNTRPRLVIDTDDVKCTHGATVGQLDDDAMFYLRSRGIGEDEARLMMIFGFTHEIVGRVRLEKLRDQIDDLVDRRLRGQWSKCYNCNPRCPSRETPETPDHA